MQGGRNNSLMPLDRPHSDPTPPASLCPHPAWLSPEVTFSHLCLSFCFLYNSLLREEEFYLQFNNSHRVQPGQHPYYRRKSYLCYQLEWSNGQEPLKGYLLSKVPDGFSDFPLPLQHIVTTMKVPAFSSSLLTHWGSVFLACPESFKLVSLHSTWFLPRVVRSMFGHHPGSGSAFFTALRKR